QVNEAVGGRVPFKELFTQVNEAVGGRVPFKELFRNVKETVGGTTSIGFYYNAINFYQFFGEEPWIEQKVAKRAFDRASGYHSSEGLKALADRFRSDYNTYTKYTDIACCGASGLITGIGISLGLIFVYPVVGGFWGAINSGIPGALKGLGSGLWNAVTFPYRNTQRNIRRLNNQQNSSIWDLTSLDWQQLKRTKFNPWVAQGKSDSQENKVIEIDKSSMNKTESYNNILTQLQHEENDSQYSSLHHGSDDEQIVIPLFVDQNGISNSQAHHHDNGTIEFDHGNNQKNLGVG
ncbi:hypothetical protein, partial [Legionella londiniensis]